MSTFVGHFVLPPREREKRIGEPVDKRENTKIEEEEGKGE